MTPVPATYHRNSYSELRGNLSYARQKKRFLLLVGQMVYSVRRRCGQQLAIEAPVEADLVSTVPESATPAALGYAQKVDVNLPFFFYFSKHISSSYNGVLRYGPLQDRIGQALYLEYNEHSC